MLRGCFLLFISVCWSQVQAQSPAMRARSFTTAIEGQQQVLAALERILAENKFMMDEDSLRAAIEALLTDETKEETDLKAHGRQTFGKDLTEADRKVREQLAGNQESYTDRYRRLEKTLATKAAARPQSSAAELLVIGQEAKLIARMAEGGSLLRENQPGLALAAIKSAVETLQKMLDAAKKAAGKEDNAEPPGGLNFTMPNLSDLSATLSAMMAAMGGDVVQALGQILHDLKVLEELVVRQRAVADQTKALAGKEQSAAKLAQEENDIKKTATDIANRLSILDPELSRLIRIATGTIDQAIPGLERGPLNDSVAPAELAVAQMQAAADRLKTVWKDILERLKQYTMAALAQFEGSAGMPGKAGSGAGMALPIELTMKMLRATGALTQAIKQETDLATRTEAAGQATNWGALQTDQDSVVRIIDEEVLPSNVTMKQLPAYLQAAETNVIKTPAAESLADAKESMGAAKAALGAQDKRQASKRERDSIVSMNNALVVMVDILQRLLGQFLPNMPAMAGPSAGKAMDPTLSDRKGPGWQTDLLPQQREAVRNAFRGTFPGRYNKAIKDYYAAIAKEKLESK